MTLYEVPKLGGDRPGLNPEWMRDLVYDGTTREPIIGLNIDPKLLLSTKARFVDDYEANQRSIEIMNTVELFAGVRFDPEETSEEESTIRELQIIIIVWRAEEIFLLGTAMVVCQTARLPWCWRILPSASSTWKVELKWPRQMQGSNGSHVPLVLTS